MCVCVCVTHTYINHTSYYFTARSKDCELIILYLYSQSRNLFLVFTHLEPEILECEVKWAFRSITTNKANGGDEIPVELFQILKEDAVKVLHSICHKIWKTQQWTQDWKRSVFIPIPNRAMPNNAQTIAQLHTSHTLAK